MSQFDSHFASTSGATLMDFHGESITFTPSGGAARTIKAIIDRDHMQPLAEFPRQLNYCAIITVFNVATAVGDDGYGGILASTLNIGKDTVTIAKRPGETPEARPLGKIVSADGAMLRIEVA